ncbi:sulfate transporter isoform X1 [Cuculus canorus]|uniref:sulfate transporter isoform X1 n=2 Tax=Cuculus canorus TaxID=55661 RepID=UPI0023AB3F65|nr:sulfate transporter isoform X1 [Cuculus canorus]XP_053936027.1 sulfate transporter isoform X1 [Cuculus canorus]
MTATFHGCLLSCFSSPGPMEDMSSLKPRQSKDVPVSLMSEETPANFIHIKLEEYEPTDFSTKDLILKKAREVCICSHQTIITFFYQLFPVLDWLPRYNVKTQLLGDVISGILVGIVAIPQSISYSLLANQDPIYGIYTNFFCNIIYVAMATSRHNSVGSFGVLCLMIGQSVNRHLQLAGYSDDSAGSLPVGNSTFSSNRTGTCDRSCYAITVALSLSFLVGLYQILLGALQLGFVAVYLSEPLLSGFVTGSCLTIITSQMKYLLGLKIPRHEGVGSFILTWVDLFRFIQNTNICDLITSLVALAIIVPVKEINDRYKERMKAPFPVELLVVIVATVISHYFNFQGRYKSAVCGDIPTGFRKPTLPDINLFSSLAVDALPIAVIGFAMTVSLAEIFGKKHGYTVRANQEMIAIGMCNLIPSFFYCFASSAALTKTLLKESTGTQTQVSGLVTSLVLLLVLLWIAPLFYSLQTSILGVVTIVNLRGGLRKFRDTPRMWQLSKLDTVVWWTTMLSSTLISTEIGLLVGVCFALLCIIFRTQRPRATLLGKVGNTEIYEDQSTYKQLSSIANIKIFRFESSLYYANKDYFKTVLYQKTGVNPILLAAKRQRVEAQANADTGNSKSFFSTKPDCLKQAKKRAEKPPADACPPSIDMHTLILDCGAMQFIDTVGLSVLKDTHHDYKEIGVQLLLANCNPSIRHRLREGGWAGETDSGGQLAFHSIHDAVQFAEQRYHVQQEESKEKKDTLLGSEDLQASL